MLFKYLGDLLKLREGEIAEYCDDYLDAETLSDHLDRSEPFSRKELCRYLGVGESTMTGWLKEDRIPLMAKEAFMLPLALRVLTTEIERLQNEAKRARILKSGDIYQICRFVPDECGEVIGEVLADNITDPQHARILLVGLDALNLLGECDERVVEQMQVFFENGENPEYEEQLNELREKIRMCRLYAVDYELWRKVKTPIELPDLPDFDLSCFKDIGEQGNASGQEAGGKEEEKS